MPEQEPPGTCETLNGEKIYFEVHGSGEPLLLLHGFSGSSQDWSTSIAASGAEWGAEWGRDFRVIVPDLRGHGRSGMLAKPFRHDDAASDMFALLDHLEIADCKGIGISGGGNVLLHMATRRPDCVKAMVLVSATPYFPEQARTIMRQYPEAVSEAQWDLLRRTHPGGDAQIQALLASTRGFADSYDDMNFTPPFLSVVRARTMIVQGDRDPLYPVELSVEMANAIPQSSLWIVPDSGHGAGIGERLPEFTKVAAKFLRE